MPSAGLQRPICCWLNARAPLQQSQRRVTQARHSGGPKRNILQQPRSSFRRCNAAGVIFEELEALPCAATSPLIYAGTVFDMDGTCTVSTIDYSRMRREIDIPVGDLFTVMESWDDGQRIKRALDIILEIEAQAAKEVQPMPGLLELLAFLRGSGVKVGLVTRNTTDSVNGFFAAIGEEWRDLFDIILTRDNTPYVKPDKRCLLEFAKAWGVKPWQLLLVGDSVEDVETANAAGTASCLIKGGGSEVSAAATAPPPLGAIPSFTVDSLPELLARLQLCDTPLGWGASTLALPASGGEDSAGRSNDGVLASGWAGAPPQGLDFIYALFAMDALRAATCSFPRLDAARFGVPPDTHPGDRVLHLACGDGALTKLLFASGLQVIGVDEDVSAAERRGLPAVQLRPLVLWPGALQPELAAMGAPFDAAVFYLSPADSESELSRQWWQQGSLAEMRRILKPLGRLCVEAPLADEAAVRQQLGQAGYSVLCWEQVGTGATRLVAEVGTSRVSEHFRG